MSSILLNPFQLLELNIISAQDLAKVTRSMRTYAVAWVRPDRKLSTRVDSEGRNSPTWNDKFVFRVDDEFLLSDTSGVMVEIYAVHWFKDILVGRVRVLINNLLPPPSRPFRHQEHVGMSFVALQVRRPSGRPQGILNIGVALLDSSMRSMPLYTQRNMSAVGYRDLMGEDNPLHHQNIYNPPSDQQHGQAASATTRNNNSSSNNVVNKPGLRRTKSDTSSQCPNYTLRRKASFREKASSLVNSSDYSSVEKKKNKGSSSRPSSMISWSDVGYKSGGGKGGSIVNGSEVGLKRKPNGKDVVARGDVSNLKPYVKRFPLDFDAPTKAGKIFITESELGPSPSEVAAAVAAKERYQLVKEPESSIVGWSINNESVEGLQSKLERWRMELPPVYDRSELLFSSPPRTPGSTLRAAGRGSGRRHARRHTDGGGLFSCVSNICGCECSIVCGE